MKARVKGETYRPVVKVLKEKLGTPTKIQVSGVTYALVHDGYINGYKSLLVEEKTRLKM